MRNVDHIISHPLVVYPLFLITRQKSGTLKNQKLYNRSRTIVKREITPYANGGFFLFYSDDN